MEFRNDGLDLKRQRDLAFLALACAMDGDEGRADHIRAISRARYEAAVTVPKKKEAV